MSQEELFKNIEILEKWYEMSIINLQQYYKLKSNLIDCFLKKPFSAEDLPF